MSKIEIKKPNSFGMENTMMKVNLFRLKNQALTLSR